MTRELPLSKGLVAVIDDEDFAWLSQWKWHAQSGKSGVYAVRKSPRGRIRLHRFITGVADGEFVDHRDRDTLNCRRANLRVCSLRQNSWNRAARKDASSGFKGVTRSRGRWSARIMAHGVVTPLGCYAVPEDAARAYDAAALRLFGEFAWLNFPAAP